VGTIEPRKGLKVLAQAAALLGDEPAIHFIVVGDSKPGADAYKREVLEIVEKKGMQGRFSFLSWRKDVPEILASSDIFCHPASIEAFGMVILEAMASGLPVIATEVGEIPDMVEQGVSGRLVEAGDSHALATAIAELATDDAARKRMGQAGRARVRSLYSLELQVRRIAGLYAGALSSGP
jgi:glycosyltransferase involved in cell wall biosynthesis